MDCPLTVNRKMDRPSKFYDAGKPDYKKVNKKGLTRINFTRKYVYVCCLAGLLTPLNFFPALRSAHIRRYFRRKAGQN